MLILFALSLAATSLLGDQPPGADDEPVRVRAQVSPGTHYIGEAVDFVLAVAGESERPKIAAPVIPDAELTLVVTDLKPISVSGIGATVEAANLYRYHFRLIPKRAGTYEIPSIKVRIGDRTGSSQSVRLTVADLPASQRPKEFLGGVGSFELSAEAEPATIRLGQILEYRIRMSGPAARGSRSAPALNRFDRSPIALEWEPLEPVVVDDPPSRLFRYRLRPTRVGEAALPPVAVAAFDPRAVRYVTKVTASVPIRVVDVPRFDPSELGYGGPRASLVKEGSRLSSWISGSVGLCLIVAVLAGLSRVVRRGLDTGENARQLAGRLGREITETRSAVELGSVITEGLAAYLCAAIGRGPGALTPTEAGLGVNLATGDRALAQRVTLLVVDCDRARFALAGPSSERLAPEAREVFLALQHAETLPAKASKHRERQT